MDPRTKRSDEKSPRSRHPGSNPYRPARTIARRMAACAMRTTYIKVNISFIIKNGTKLTFLLKLRNGKKKNMKEAVSLVRNITNGRPAFVKTHTGI